MGSHYIPVGKIKIDKEILDIACPAAGYGETPPDPAIYCPANGYDQPTEIWEPPVAMPEPESEQILLLVNDMGAAALSFYVYVSSGNKKFELLSTDMNIIYSEVFSTTSYTYFLPTNGTGAHYIVRFTPETPGQSITRFYRNTITGYPTDWPVLQAKFYTPNLQQLSNGFNGMTSLREISFHSNMNSLTTLYYAFAYTPIEKITWPEEMNSLDDIRYMLAYTTGAIYDLSSAPLNSVTKADYLLRYSLVEKLIMPSTMNALLTAPYLAGDCPTLKEVVLPVSCPVLTNLSSAFYNDKNLKGTITFPEMPNVENLSSACQSCENITKIVFQGTANNCTNINYLGRYAKKLEEIVFPTSMNSLTGLNQYFIQNNETCKKMVLPLSMNSFSDNSLSVSTNFNNLIEEITTCNQWGPNSIEVSLNSFRLKAFNQPTLKCSRLQLGYNGVGSSKFKAPLTEVHIDWANSDFDSTIYGIIIIAELDATEIDRIFGLLPTTSLGRAIDVQYCPGFAGCTPSIAQAKGWTVTDA